MKYHNLFYIEALPGKDRVGDLGLGTVQGVTAGRWSVGAGVSRDFYNAWSVRALFGSVMLDLFRVREDAGFILIDAGRARTRPLLSEDNPFLHTRSGRAGMWSICGGWRRSSSRGDLFLAVGVRKQNFRGSYFYRWGDIPSPSMEYGLKETISRLRVVMAYRFE